MPLAYIIFYKQFLYLITPHSIYLGTTKVPRGKNTKRPPASSFFVSSPRLKLNHLSVAMYWLVATGGLSNKDNSSKHDCSHH